METIKSKISQGGLLLAALGILSMVLAIFNYNIRLLSWIDFWGNTMGWIIRIVLIVGGCALFIRLGNDLDLEVDVDLELDDK